MREMMNWWRYSGAAGLLCAASTVVAAGAKYTLLDESLKGEPIELVGLDVRGGGAGKVIYLDAQGARHEVAGSKVLALAPAWWSSEVPSLGEGRASTTQIVGPWIELVDGQRFTGNFEGAVSQSPSGAAEDKAGKGDAAIHWLHTLGTLTFKLDDVLQYVGVASAGAVQQEKDRRSLLVLPQTKSSTAAPAASPTKDALTLRNGDHLEGFIDRLGPEVVLEPAGSPPGAAAGAAKLTVPIQQVTRARLANNRRGMDGLVSWLSDGSVVGLHSAQLGTGRTRLELSPTLASADAGASLETSALVALSLDAARIRALADLEMVRGKGAYQAEVVRGHDGTEEAALGAPDIFLPAPMRVEWTLPAGCSRVAGTAVMDESCWVWGDCLLSVSVVSADGAAHELAQQRINGERPVFEINVALGKVQAGEKLRVEVDAGAHGPIQDRVTLEHMLVLLGR